MNKLLITGGSGFIGRNLANYYIQRGISVRLMLRNPQQAAPNLRSHCEIVQGDITESESFAGAFEGVDAVIHSAGQLGQFGMPYNDLERINVLGALNVLKGAMDAGVPRYVHLSAGGVTGPLKQKFVDETYPPSPVTDYERTKWEGERRILALAQKEDYNLLILRPTFTYGPGDPHKLKLFKAIKQGRFFYIGNGRSTVHPVYIDDLVKGIDAGLNSEARLDSIIIGGERAVTKQEFYTAIAEALDVSPPRLKVPPVICNIAAIGFEAMAKLTGMSPALTRSQVLALSKNWGYTIDKATKLIGFQPAVDINEGVKKTATWYQQQGWL